MLGSSSQLTLWIKMATILLSGITFSIIVSGAGIFDIPRPLISNIILSVFIVLAMVASGCRRGRDLRVLMMVTAFVIALSVPLAITAMVVAEDSISLANMLGSPFTHFGYYPSGPDAWFTIGALFWGLSWFAIVSISGLLGVLIGHALALVFDRD